MARRLAQNLLAPSLVALVLGCGSYPVVAQDTTRHGHHARHLSQASATETAPVTYRGLTINRTPEAGFPNDQDDQDIYRDGPTRYNDIRDFSPAPYVTSGVEYPYGLDGIGGYGSDLGFSAGEDTALYDRGAGSRP